MRVHTQKGMKDNYMIFAMRAADEQRAAVKANTHRGNAERRDFLTEIVKTSQPPQASLSAGHLSQPDVP